jgi:hypothetical protein
MNSLVLFALSCAFELVQDPAPLRVPTPDAPAEPAVLAARLHALLRSSQSIWEQELELVRADFQRAPRETIQDLVRALGDATVVPGLALESTMYTVRGNALVILEDFTDLRIDEHDREWIGFRVHDHRGIAPDEAQVRRPWEAWLRTREGLPVSHWFHGLSARELHALQRVLRTPHATWTDALLAPARALGPRAYARLLHYLVDEEWACAGERQCDQANRLLAKLQGGEPEPLERYDLLSIDPRDPLRAEEIALVRNRLAMHAVQERWSARLLSLQSR